MKFLKLLSFKNKQIFKIWQFVKLDFRYFNMRSFEFPKYQPFYMWSFQMLTHTNTCCDNIGEGQILERSNVERPIFRKFETSNYWNNESRVLQIVKF